MASPPFLPEGHVVECSVAGVDQAIKNIILDSVQGSTKVIGKVETDYSEIPMKVAEQNINKNENNEIVW